MTGSHTARDLEAPIGVDLDCLQRWLANEVPEWASAGGLTARHLSGGRSNLTYEIVTTQGSLVLRRPPVGQVLPTAHDMGREYRVLTALTEGDVPVPRPVALCADPSILGAPFYLMEKVEGVTYSRAAQLAKLGPGPTRAISIALIDTLVKLHEVNYEAVGLAEFGWPDGFVGRQVRRWRAQLESSRTRDLRGVDDLYQALESRLPVDGQASIVHGDYKLDNVLIHGTRPAAVIDWEMSTLGDPLTDLALVIIYQRLGSQAGSDSVTDSASAPGFLSEGEILGRYSNQTGCDLGGFGFYLALAAFKLAGILEGVYYRHINGQTVGAGFDQFADIPELLIDAGIASLKEYS